jgi:hypothetical protein
MEFKTTLRVSGMKGSKGTLDNGSAFDSTKVYVETALDDSKGMGKGFATAEYNFGTSEEFHKYKHLPFPLECEAQLEIVTNGKTQKTIIKALRPLEAVRAPVKAGA